VLSRVVKVLVVVVSRTCCCIEDGRVWSHRNEGYVTTYIHSKVVRVLLKGCKGFSGGLLEGCQDKSNVTGGVVRVLLGCCQGIIKGLSGSCQEDCREIVKGCQGLCWGCQGLQKSCQLCQRVIVGLFSIVRICQGLSRCCQKVVRKLRDGVVTSKWGGRLFNSYTGLILNTPCRVIPVNWKMTAKD